MLKHKIKILCTLVAIFAGAYVWCWSPLPLVSSWWSFENFDPIDPLYKRNRIADGLLLSDRLNGLSRTEVEALLGPAHDTTYFNNWDMVYYLGHERGVFGIDSEWLVINLDNAGNTEEYQITRD